MALFGRVVAIKPPHMTDNTCNSLVFSRLGAVSWSLLLPQVRTSPEPHTSNPPFHGLTRPQQQGCRTTPNQDSCVLCTILSTNAIRINPLALATEYATDSCARGRTPQRRVHPPHSGYGSTSPLPGRILAKPQAAGFAPDECPTCESPPVCLSGIPPGRRSCP